MNNLPTRREILPRKNITKAATSPRKRAPSAQCKLSIAVATRNRAWQLERMLTSLEQQTVSMKEVNVVVVVNGTTDNTREVLARKSKVLNIVTLTQDVASKAMAMNLALEHVSGDFIVFTDDDITVEPNWLRVYQSAVTRYPSASLFCGPITPVFPAQTPTWLHSDPVSNGLFFGNYEPRVSEGPLPEPLSEYDFPCGANFAVRRRVLRTMRFDHSLGPSQEHGALYDEDTEFVGRLHSRFGEVIYVPQARVMHHVESRQIQWPALFEKTFHYGRTVAIRNRTPMLPPSPKEPSQEEDAAAIARFEKGCVLNFLWGQLHEFRRLGLTRSETILTDLLEPLEVRANRDLLSRSALACALEDAAPNDDLWPVGLQLGGGRDPLMLGWSKDVLQAPAPTGVNASAEI
jgi:glucosyl-dolichyl phosphate glucuronosyltransferase